MISNRQMKYISRNSKVMLQFQLTGRAPNERLAPSTPLRALIESIPRSEWCRYRDIHLSPELGFNANFTFSSLYQLWYWLGGNRYLIGNQRLPYQYYDISQTKHVTLSQLKSHANFR